MQYDRTSANLNALMFDQRPTRAQINGPQVATIVSADADSCYVTIPTMPGQNQYGPAPYPHDSPTSWTVPAVGTECLVEFVGANVNTPWVVSIDWEGVITSTVITNLQSLVSALGGEIATLTTQLAALEPGPWVTITSFSNGWGAQAGSVPQYKKVGTFVYLRGQLLAGASAALGIGATITDSTAWPPGSLSVLVDQDVAATHTAQSLIVTTAGQIEPHTGSATSGTTFSLFGVFWDTAAT